MNIQEFYPIYQQSRAIQIDSRKILPGDVFFAFSGAGFNAAELAENAVKNGATAVIVEDKAFENADKNIFHVDSTLLFLQDLARFHRKHLTIPVFALTGSNGKTTTKELIHAVLSQKYSVCSTVGNYNNHIGVPLTLLAIQSHHEIAVVEMGANHQKEIAFLCELARPTFGYITNFGKAHLEGFGGMQGVIAGKSEMYAYLKQNNCKILVNEADAVQLTKMTDYSNVLSFGRAESDFYFESFSEDFKVGLTYLDAKILSNLTGQYNFSNLSAAVALALFYDVPLQKVCTAIENYAPDNMRSQIISKNGKTLVLDTYNANPSSMEASLINFQTFPGSKTIIIGDMLELGEESRTEHEVILMLAKRLQFEQIITVGNHFKNINTTSLGFLNAGELIHYLKKDKIISKNILLKGSRGIALEKILDHI